MDKELQKIVKYALSEDIGVGDISSSLLGNNYISAEVISRDRAIICGVEYFDLCFLSLDSDVEIEWKVKEGSEIMSGDVICSLYGKSQAIITAERTALNFLQILSATATQTNYLVSLIADTNAQLLGYSKNNSGSQESTKICS